MAQFDFDQLHMRLTLRSDSILLRARMHRSIKQINASPTNSPSCFSSKM